MDRGLANRAGGYVNQLAGYRSFVPSPLPPTPPVDMTDLWNVLSLADRALGRLDGASESLPNPDLFVFMYVRKEAVLSSQIEGTQASLIDVLQFEADGLKQGKAEDVGEVINYIAAMNYGLDRLDELPISLRLIREIHAQLLTGVRGGERTPGEFRRTQTWVGHPGSNLATATYVPPAPYDMLASLDNLERFIHSDANMPFLIKVGLIHAQFETIHPFLDGNGRTGRLLITFLLCQQKLLTRPLLYLSYYFKAHRTEYYDRLQAVRDAGDWEGWLNFFLRGVYEVSKEATETARQIVNLREEHRHLIPSHLGASSSNALRLLELLFTNPIIDVRSVSAKLGLSFAYVNTIIRDLTQIGILSEITGNRRNRKFSYTPYLDLLDSH